MITADDIVRLLEDNGITAADEYFPNDTEMPYAVVLTPSSRIECPDTGGMQRIISRAVTFRIELFTLSRSDPVRQRFMELIVTSMPADSFETDEQSFGANYGYMTAIEFEVML